jgi:hypothetical protein
MSNHGLNRDDGAYLLEEYMHWQVTSSLGYLRSHDCIFRSPLMKTLDWSVETLGLDYNSTGLCNHLFKPENNAHSDNPGQKSLAHLVEIA